MRALIQVVTNANVTVKDEVVGNINKGLCIFLGVGKDDDEIICEKFISKLLKLRIFDDENGKTNLSLKDISGSVLLVSQFTLYANCIKGNRPNFLESADPKKANYLYEYAKKIIKDSGYHLETGSFGSEMLVKLTNDGPFTIWLDSDILK